MTFAQIHDLTEVQLAEGVKIRMVPGNRLMWVLFYLSPGARIPEHTHPHEQMGMVLKGAIHLTIGNKEETISSGVVYRVPPEVPHSGRCLDADAEVLDVFSPPREDLMEKLAPSRPERQGPR